MHIGFPFRVDHRGRTASADDEEYVRGLIEQVLFTAPGERVNRPGFGSGLRQLLFEPASGELATATRALVQAALQQWLGAEIEVQAVDVVADDATVRVTVQYRTRSAPAPVTAVITRAV
ncbi:GPW/gp25 family protein [Streptomyces hyaluromycini]|uniref:GPW/gp25 family protein n=1 Tax=Streptomyces hyaluromycini TaxID=1377993 RepID=UPI000B5C7549|nr:GPW/gp25 family protein [Streptomyces hyaluromycini]